MTHREDLKPVNPQHWKRPSGYSNGMMGEGLLFIAGQIGWDENGVFAEGLVNQVRQALLNIRAVAEAADVRVDRIARLTWYVTDRKAYKAQTREIGAVYREIIGRHFPAMAVVEVKGLVEDEALVEIEATLVF